MWHRHFVAVTSPHFAAASANQFEMLNFLKAKGANINIGAGQRTPLHKAVESGGKKAAMALKANGANLRAENSQGYILRAVKNEAFVTAPIESESRLQ